MLIPLGEGETQEMVWLKKSATPVLIKKCWEVFVLYHSSKISQVFKPYQKQTKCF